MPNENKTLKTKKVLLKKSNPLYKKVVVTSFLLFSVALVSGLLISKQRSKKTNSEETIKNNEKYKITSIKPDVESYDKIASFLNQDPQPIVLKHLLSGNRLRTLYVLRWLFEQENSFLLYVELKTRKELLSSTMRALFTAMKAYLSSNDISKKIDIWPISDGAGFYYNIFCVLLKTLTEFNEQFARTIFEAIVFFGEKKLRKITFLNKKLEEITQISDVINSISSSEITFNKELYVFLEIPNRVQSFDFTESFFQIIHGQILDPENQCFEFKPTYFIVTENSREVAYFKRNNTWFKFDQGLVKTEEKTSSFSQLHMIIFSAIKV